MSTIKANAYLDASGGNTATINGRSFIVSTDTIAANNNNTTIPTSAAVKNYADGVVSTTTVLAAAAGGTAGGIGTYGLVIRSVGTAGYTAGSTIAGSSLQFTNASGSSPSSALTGTWQFMGTIQAGATTTGATTVAMRIA